MIFGAHHYVPVLKAKRGEKTALRRMSPNVRARMTPLLEVVARTEKDLAAHLDTVFKDLAESVSLYSRCFLDVRELAPEGSVAALEVFQRATNAGIVFTPVTGVSRTADVAASLAHRRSGLALRLTRDEFEKGDLAIRIQSFLGSHGLAANDIDLIIDLGSVDDLIVDGVAALTEAFMADVPQLKQWRTLTVSACAFPLSMGIVERHSHDFVERTDWMAWRDHLHARRSNVPRLPAFSDCAIQHPRGVEGFNPRIMQVSASIRYTLNEQWLLVKGEGTRSTPPSLQFPVLATRLVYGHLKTHFAGPGHCVGCFSIKEAADGVLGYGSAEAWRRIGTVHHMSTVMQGLGSLLWS